MSADPTCGYPAGCKIICAASTAKHGRDRGHPIKLPFLNDPSMAEQLAAIANVIRELVGDDLAMLILLGSYARGDWVNDRYVEGDIIYTYQSDFDLLLVSEHRSHATVDGEFRFAMPSAGVCVGLDLTAPAPR